MIFSKLQSSFFVLSFAAALSASSPASAATLEESVRAALINHPSIDSAKAFLEGSSAERKAEFSGYFPELSVTGTGGRVFGDNATSRGLSVTRGEGYSYLWEGSATLRQPVFDGFATSSLVSAAKAREKSADMDLVDVRESLALRTAQAYINVMRTHAALNMLKTHKVKVDDYLERIKLSVDEGASDEAEYQQARDVSVVLAGFITEYEGQVRASETAYFEAVGAFPKGEMDAPSPDVRLIPSEIEQAILSAKNSHPSLKSAMYREEAAKHGIRSERSALYPGLDSELSYLKTDKEDIIGGEVEDAKAVLRLNWRFETGGGQIQRVRKKKYEHHEARARVREIERQIETSIHQSYSDLKTFQAHMKHQKSRLNLNTKLFETYESQYEGARISMLQLMQADNQLFNVKLEMLNAEYRVLAAQYAVLATIGQLQNSISLAALDHEQE